MRRTNLTKKNKRHSRRHTRNAKSRRVRKVGGAGYSAKDMDEFESYIKDKNTTPLKNKDTLLKHLNTIPFEKKYVFAFSGKKEPTNIRGQGIDRIQAFNKFGDQWW